MKNKNINVLLNFGKTRTYIDKIRYITNNSSGKMGYYLYQALLKYTNNIKTIIGDIEINFDNYDYQVKTNVEMLKHMKLFYDNANIVICNAALNDYQVKNYSDNKLDSKKSQTIELIKNIDILYELGKIKKNQFLIGFSLQENIDNIEKAHSKLIAKNLDLIILNSLDKMSNNFNEVTLLFRNKKIIKLANNSKELIAKQIAEIIMKIA